jgi:predicted AlkP superfamily pyrophosphatase or phosphodiesterase
VRQDDDPPGPAKQQWAIVERDEQTAGRSMTVILVIVDGLRPDAIHRVHSPHFDELMRNGAISLTARSVNPSVTLPAHMTAFHSVPPERHGVLDNTDRPLRHLGPGLFEQVHAESDSAAMV